LLPIQSIGILSNSVMPQTTRLYVERGWRFWR